MANRRRLKDDTYYKDLTKQLRKISHKFDAENGYDLRYLHEWSPARKAAITKAYAQVSPYLSRPHKVYRARNKKNLKAVQKFSNQPDAPSWQNVALIQVVDPTQPARVRVTKSGKVKLKERTKRGFWIESENVIFDTESLIESPLETVRESLESYDKDDLFVIITGEHLSSFGGNKDQTVRATMHLAQRYNADKYDPDDKNSKYFGNWLYGLRHIGAGTRKDFIDYATQRQQASEKRAAENKARKEKRRQLFLTRNEIKAIERDITRMRKRAQRQKGMNREFTLKDIQFYQKHLQKLRLREKKLS